MLRISKLTDYGTMVLACLATRPDQRLTAAAVAEVERPCGFAGVLPRGASVRRIGAPIGAAAARPPSSSTWMGAWSWCAARPSCGWWTPPRRTKPQSRIRALPKEDVAKCPHLNR